MALNLHYSLQSPVGAHVKDLAINDEMNAAVPTR